MAQTGKQDTHTMEAVRFHDYGGADALHVELVPRPEPGVGEVLVHIRAASVNPADWKLREGGMKNFMALTLPFTPGCDFAGTVAAVGVGVTTFEAGDAVVGMTPPQKGGAYAEYVSVPATQMVRKPDGLSFVDAASFPVAALTAWQGLHDSGGLKSGQSVLIHGGAGGVGIFATQFARQAGANPIYVTASGADKEFVESLGATQAIDYKNERFEEIAKNVDVVLDLVGGETQERSWGVLKPGGILVSVTSPPSEDKAAAHGVRAAMLHARPTQEQLTLIADLLANGTVNTVIGKTFGLTEARAAQEQSRHGHTRGKIVLTAER